MGRMKKHTISYASFFMCCILGLSACSSGITGARSMEPVAVLDYDVPVGLPNIMTDLTGYSSGAEKYAYLRLAPGQDEVVYFSVRDLDRDRIVFEGMFEDAKGNDSIKKADFSSLTASGNYRIECDIYGYSQNFTISPDCYLAGSIRINAEVMESLKNLTATPVSVLDFLQAYEWYGMPDASDPSIVLLSEGSVPAAGSLSDEHNTFYNLNCIAVLIQNDRCMVYLYPGPFSE